MDEPVFTPQDLLALTAEAVSAQSFVPWGETPLLLVDVHDGEIGAEQSTRLTEWLRSLPCPVIGRAGGDDALPPWAAACDVIAAAAEDIAPLLANIRRRPRAAATFVQLLRHSEGVPLEAALAAESLAYAALQAGPEHRAWLAGHERRDVVVEDEGPAVLCARDGNGLRITLNRPRRGNAMSVEMRDALLQALHAAAADASIASVRIDGRGDCFSTGGDLDEFGTVPDPVTGHLVRSLALPGRALAALGGRATAVVHGRCIGSGMEFPAFAARVVARPDAQFRLPELEFGLIPGAGGCVSVPRRIGRQRTAWMVLGGATVDAGTALAWGLVDAVEADG